MKFVPRVKRFVMRVQKSALYLWFVILKLWLQSHNSVCTGHALILETAVFPVVRIANNDFLEVR